MKAIVVHQYGGPEVLKFEDYPDPVPGEGEVLVRVAATSVNPIDYKRRAGLTKDFYPLRFPGLIGVDMAGTVVKIGPGVEGFSVGDQVFAMADNTYAELCAVKAAVLAKVPKGLDLIQAAALPLVTTTGNQLLSATGIKAGQTVLVVGAVGNVGRSAVFTAKERGATVIAGVLKRQMDEAKTVCADRAVATDPLTSTLPPPPPTVTPPSPPHPAQHSPRSRRAILHSALPFNQLSHPPHRPLPRPHHLRTALQLFLHPLQLFPMELPWSSQPPRLQRPHPSPPNLFRPLVHRLPPHSQPPRHLRLP